MKKMALAILLTAMISQTFAYTVKHSSKKKSDLYILSKFTVCNEMSYPIYFTAWALDRPNAYRWADWIQASECRTDEFDKYYESALYEFSGGLYEPPFKDYILREGETYTLSPFNPLKIK